MISKNCKLGFNFCPNFILMRWCMFEANLGKQCPTYFASRTNWWQTLRLFAYWLPSSCLGTREGLCLKQNFWLPTFVLANFSGFQELWYLFHLVRVPSLFMNNMRYWICAIGVNFSHFREMVENYSRQDVNDTFLTLDCLRSSGPARWSDPFECVLALRIFLVWGLIISERNSLIQLSCQCYWEVAIVFG